MEKASPPGRLVIFGASNIVSDLFDCALANGLRPAKVVLHWPEAPGERDIPLAARIAALEGLCDPPYVEMLDDFQPGAGELYLLGPTTPARRWRPHATWSFTQATALSPRASSRRRRTPTRFGSPPAAGRCRSLPVP